MDINSMRPGVQETQGFRPAAPAPEQGAPAQGPAQQSAEQPQKEDAFKPTGDLAGEEKEKETGGIPAFGKAGGPPKPGSKEAQDRKDDENLLQQNAGGDSDGASSGASGDNPLKGLEDRDQEVKKHEGEHLAAAGEYAVGGPEFDTVTSKSGKSFAMGGKVHVDTSEVMGDAQKTVDKMQKVQKAALAPASPSGQDFKVAGEAAATEAKARGQLAGKDNMAQQPPGGKPPEGPEAAAPRQ